MKRCRAASLRSPRASISKFASAVARCNRCSPSSASESSNPGSGVAIIEAFATVLGEEIQPVSVKAQRKIEIPDDLASEEPMSAEWDYLLASSDDEDGE